MALLFKDEVYTIVGAAFEVYNDLGPGFLEAVYQEALAMELTERHIPFVAHKELKIFYKGRALIKSYIPDFTCYDSIILEIKAIESLSPADQAQILNYMNAAQLTTGILINFGTAKSLQWRRLILSKAAIGDHLPPLRSA
jgi:GxxExxY protein